MNTPDLPPRSPQQSKREPADSADEIRENTPTPGDAQIRRQIRRAALRWLIAEKDPSGAAQNVVTRIHRIRADIAAFWSRPLRNAQFEGPARILEPSHTLIIECSSHREECWPDCADSARAAPQLVELRHQQARLEADIRRREPQLRDTNTLFEEYAEWKYEQSENPDYRRIRKEVEALEHALYAGTRFERIREAAVADELYLAVPENLIEPAELADGWGLLWVRKDLSVEVKRLPVARECLPENRLHLVQNIAAAGLNATLFAAGIRPTDHGPTFVRTPRGRRRPEHPELF